MNGAQLFGPDPKTIRISNTVLRLDMEIKHLWLSEYEINS